MVILIRENGNSIKPMEKEFINIRMAQYMMENGWMICNMVMELKYGMMDQDLKVFINLEKNMDKVNFKIL